MWWKFKKKKKNQPFISINESDGLNENYLFDFSRNPSSSQIMTNGVFFGNVSVDGESSISLTSGDVEREGSGGNNAKAPIKIKMKPIDVLDELETLPTPWTLCNLDDKIAMLEIKEKIITQKYAKREVSALKDRLYNRKKYDQFKEFFDQFPYTSEEKIQKLLSKYDLVMKTSDIFIPEFPDDAVRVMEKYITKVEELCGKKPIFYVIATSDNFRDADGKRDPILLAQSPFSFQYQILGAWDKEMLLLSEL